MVPSGWQEFLAVTLPGLRREIAVVLSVNLINALRAFDVVKATTDGGPGDSTTVLALYMMNTLDSNQAGYRDRDCHIPGHRHLGAFARWCCACLVSRDD